MTTRAAVGGGAEPVTPASKNGEWGRGLVGRGLHILLRMLMATVRVRWTDDEHQLAATKDGPCIYTLWHGNQLPLLVPFRGSSRTILISWSRDGTLLDHVARALGYRTVRGSSSRGASEAMAALREELDAGRSVILAVDGPRGPARTAKKGAVRVAETTGRPILPVGFLGSGVRLKTWDRFFIPFPFSRLVIRRGPPLYIAQPAPGEASVFSRGTPEVPGPSNENESHRLAGALEAPGEPPREPESWLESGACRLTEALKTLETPLPNGRRIRPGALISCDTVAGKTAKNSRFDAHGGKGRVSRFSAVAAGRNARVSPIGAAADPSGTLPGDLGGLTDNRVGPGSWSTLYSGLTRCLEVFVSPLWRLGTARGWRRCQHGLERLGLYPHSEDLSSCIWIHAASVGEVNVARSFLSILERLQKPEKVVLTCTSLTGRSAARDLPGVRAYLAPFDLSACLRRTLERLKPRAIFLVETELWPGLLRAAHRSGIPVAMINARISEQSFSSYFRWRGLFGPLLEPVYALARTEGDAGRLRALGVSRERCRVGGDLKLLQSPAREVVLPESLVDWLRSGQVFVAASTHPGEEALILEALEPLWTRWPRLRLVLAPRHPDHFDEQVLGGDASPKIARRSEMDQTSVSPDAVKVLLLDTVGELRGLYPFAFAVFVGGTLLEGVGGHNLLEVARAARLCLYGPHTEGVGEQVDLLEPAGAGLRCDGPETLRSYIELFLTEPAEAYSRGRLGRDAVHAAEAGVEASIEEWLEDWLNEEAGGRSG